MGRVGLGIGREGAEDGRVGDGESRGWEWGG